MLFSEGERTPCPHLPPQDLAAGICRQPNSLSLGAPSKPPGLTPTHSSQAFLSQSFYFLPYPVPQIQRSALKWRLFPSLIETRPPSPPPPPCCGVSSNRDWLPASPPWGSSNKEQLPNLIETKGRPQGIPPLSLQLVCCPLCLPASSGAWEWGGGGHSPSLALGAWEEVLPVGPLFPKAAKPWAWVTCYCSAQKVGPQRSCPPASPAAPSHQVPSGRECKINVDTGTLPCTPFGW